MPEYHLALWVIEGDELKLTVSLKRTDRVIELPLLLMICSLSIRVDQAIVESSSAVQELYLGDDYLFYEAVGYALCNVQGGGLKTHAFLLFAIG